MKHLKASTAVQHLLQAWTSPTYVLMVGPPGSGKSTFRELFIGHVHEPVYVASTDDLIEREAKLLGVTYSQAFHKVNQKTVKQEMEAGIAEAILEHRSIVHDQTNMSKKSRTSKLRDVPDVYLKVCLNFTVDDRELLRRLTVRAELTGKVIPPNVLSNMFASYSPPTKGEGFNLIIEIDNTYR